jgi:hypothetical protein
MFSHPYLSGQLASDRHREVLASAEQHRLAASSAPRSGHRGRPAGPPSACAGRCIATARRTEISA